MSFAGKLDRVGQEVQQDLLQSIMVSFDDEAVAHKDSHVEMEADRRFLDR